VKSAAEFVCRLDDEKRMCFFSAMASRRQSEANRRNAQRSTGPRTPEGRAVSSANATRHGVLSNRFVAEHEVREDFDELRNQLMRDFEPGTTLEMMLVERLAMLFWRERRLAAAEAEKLQRRYASARDPFSGGSSQNLPIIEQYLVGRYQGLLGRQIRDTLRDLRDERDRHLRMIEGRRSDEGGEDLAEEW
jgi:hypothetical protein